MTEIIDLATLANLGQHFANLEDVAELRASLLLIQNDLSLIKNFLANQFGADFDAEIAAENYEELEVYPTAKIMRGQSTNANSPAAGGQGRRLLNAQVHVSQVQQAQTQNRTQKPPPLQRFTVINSRGSSANGNGSGTSSGVSVTNRFISRPNGNGAAASQGTYGTGATGGTEKFHRNFLSMSSLKKPASSSAGAAETLKKLNQNPNVKVEPQTSDNGSRMPPLKLATVKDEEVYYNDGTEVYDENEEAETGYNEDDQAYDETGQVGEGEEVEGNYDQAAYEGYVMEDGNEEYEVQEEDGLVYEENYDGEEQDMIDPNQMMEYSTPSQSNVTPRSTNNGSTGARSNNKAASNSKKIERRISMPAITGQEDPNFLKNCKICHEDIPSFALFNHVVNDHYGGDVPTCKICKKTFTYKQGLISHMRYHDVQKYDKACSYCGKRFIRRSDVIIHERRLHTGERPYLCPAPQCNQGFVRRYCLLTHIKTNHGEPYMSQVMAQSTRRKSS